MTIEPDVNLAHNIHMLKTIVYPVKSHLLTKRNFIKENEAFLQRHKYMFQLWPRLESQSGTLMSLHQMNTGFSTDTKNTTGEDGNLSTGIGIPARIRNQLSAFNKPADRWKSCIKNNYEVKDDTCPPCVWSGPP